MLFNSPVFFVLAISTFAFYYLPFCSKHQVSILTVSSLVFYSYNQPILVLLLLFSVFINIVSSYYVVYGTLGYQRYFAIGGVVLNLSILLFFKYSPLIAKTLFKETSSIGEYLITIPLPIGISFFTFQGISLVIDVYKEKYVAKEELVPPIFLQHARQILFFKAFFPQLISGPIVKAHEFIPQIGRKKLFDVDWESCFKNLIMGYFLKMVVADNLKDFTQEITYPYFQGQSTSTLIVMLVGYSCQIFADFAGYSLIAIGLAKIFGYQFRNNFNFPYVSSSFKDFWKRWHISLSTFLMEYLYFPLGGNRNGKLRTYFNLLLTMILGGLWHGAAWSYAVWGCFHGMALVLERFLADKFNFGKNKIFTFVKVFVVFSFVSFAWLLFKLPEFKHVINYIESISNNSQVPDNIQIITFVCLYSMPVFLYHVYYLLKENRKYEILQKSEPYLYGLLLFLIVVNSGTSGTFIYFQF
jgi:alginate O-acetyltransferase complex protein AlgI